MRALLTPGRLAALLLAVSVPLRAETAGCTPIFTPDDPRLFDFVKTRRAVDYAPWQGMTIDSIRVVALPIFNTADPKENNAVYRLANRLHTETRPGILEKQLLIHPGEPLDVDRLRESERILRAQGYLYDGMILPENACDGRVSLMVVVRDLWTLQPTASFKRTGGQNSTSVGFTDDNLLGYGHSVAISWDKNAQRSGVALNFDSSHLFDGHTVVGAGYAKNNDGRHLDLLVDRPFYAFDTRWATGFSTLEDRRRDTESVAGVSTNRYDERHRQFEVYGGIAEPPEGRVVRRWRLGMTYDGQLFGNQDPVFTAPIPGNRRTAYPWMEFERRENTFVTTSNLTQLFRNEDVNLGEEWRVRVGATMGWMPSDTDALITQVDYKNTIGFGTHHLMRNEVSANLTWDERSYVWVNSLVSAATSYDYFIDDNNRWHARLGLDAGEGLSTDKMITAGGDVGLRGYSSGWQRGDRRVIFNVERRHFYNTHPFNLFRIGAAAFVDVGQAWDSTGAVQQPDKVLSDIGIGMRINSSKARPTHVMHLDIAMPLADRARAKSIQWSVRSQAEF